MSLMNVFSFEPHEKVHIDADRIVPGLYQGSIPPQGEALRLARFTVLVLAAVQFQPKAERFPGVRVIHVPLEDSHVLTKEDIHSAATVANLVATAVKGGARVLVTCLEGRNRSGLITALALRDLYGMSGAEALLFVKKNRKNADALTNTTYQQFLLSIPRKSP